MSKATRKNIEAIYPLSPTQQGMLFHSLYDRESGVYVEQLAATLRGDLDVSAFSQAWQRVVDRHAVLRTAFAWKRLEQMMQVVRQRVTVPIVQEDWRHYPAEEQEKRLDAWLEAERRRGFDLAKAPLMRLALMRISDQAHYFVWSHHHALLDGWSLPLVLQEVFVLYEAFRLGQDVRLPPVRPYREYIEWLAQQDEEAAESFWREQLRGFSAPTSLVVERAPEQTSPQQMQYGKEEAKLSAEDTRQLHDMARSYGITLSTLLQGAWALLLSRYNDQADVLFGATVSGRPAELAGVERMVGLFINTIPVRVQVDEQEKVGAWLQAHQRRAFAARQFEHAPLALIQQWSDVPAGTPLFQSILVFENYPQDEAAQARQGSVSIEDVHSVEYSNYPLAVVSAPATELTLRIRYDRSRFDDAVIARMVQHLANLLLGMISQPEQPLAGVSMLSEAERTQIVEQWNDTDVDAPSSTVVEQFEQQVQRTPSAPAFVFGQEQWTYATLNQRANQLAWHLRELGVGPETPVGILMERSPEMVLAVLAVLKAGGAYLPIDPTYPPERIRYMIEDSGVKIVVGDQSSDISEQMAGGQPKPDAVAPVVLHMGEASIASKPTSNPDVSLSPDNLAYVIYTSGSTGRPKGVLLHHRGLMNFIVGQRKAYGGDVRTNVLQFASFSFDAAVAEIVWALANGGSLHLAERTVLLSEKKLAELIRHRQVNAAILPPTILKDYNPALFPTLHTVVSAGEACTWDIVERWLPGGRVFLNGYGPTETTIGPTSYRVRNILSTSTVPVGRPLDNVRVYLLDEFLQPVPVGVPGEIYISGPGVARGYLDRPDITAERFLPDPFALEAGSRMYRTGDLARWLADGNIEYLGRVDFQVKIRGFRVELGEIDNLLLRHPAVENAVTVALTDTPGGPRLVAYVIPRTGESLTAGELRAFVEKDLPDYMVPSYFMIMAEFPLSPNGKVDRKALPAPEISRGDLEKPYVAPRTHLEKFLAKQFQEVLGVEQVGIHDNFFELGGDSLLAASFINRLQERFQETTRVRSIFLAPTVAELAYHLPEYYPAIVSKISGNTGDQIPDELLRDMTYTTAIINAEVVRDFRNLIPALPKTDVEEPEAKNPSAVFILSPPRSGSTLLRVMLAGNPRLFAPPELDILSFSTMDERRRAFRGSKEFWLEGTIKAVAEARGIPVTEAERLLYEYESQGMTTKAFYAALQEWIGVRLLVDKTPVYSLSLDVLQSAEANFENARYIHLMRNPYATIYSFVEAKLDNLFCRFEQPYSRRELAELIWIVSHQNILEFLASVPGERHHRLSYEELVRQPEAQMRSMSEFLGIPYHPNMLRPYLGDRMTSGLKPGKQMVGDFKFYLHNSIDSSVADKWKTRHIGDFLSDVSLDLALRLGYDERELTAEPALVASAWQPILPAPAGVELPLSFAQQRLWFLDQFDPGNAIYNMPTAVGMTGTLDLDALTQAINEIVRRHDTLRTRIVTKEGKASQVIDPFAPFTLPITDLSHLPSAEREQEARRLVEVEAQAPFDLAQGPLFRAKLIKLVEGDAGADRQDDTILLFTLHHIISDGWSTRVLVRELSQLYRAISDNRPVSLPPLPIQYADFAYWQRQWLQGEVLESQLNYWREQLIGAPALLELPTDHPRPPVQTYRGADLFFTLPESLASSLRNLSQQEGVTLFMALLAAFQTLMHRYSHQPDICVGTPIANRNRAELENLIGFFVNTLVMRTDFTGSPSYRALLQRVREVALGAYDHQDLPFEYLVDQLGVERNMSHSPLFQVMFTLDSAASGGELAAADVSIRSLDSETTTARFDLVLSMIEDGDALVGSWEYNTDLFEQSTIRRMADHFLILLADAIAHPDTAVDRLQLFPEAEAEQLHAWNDTQKPIPMDEPVFRRIERYAQEQPDAVAVRFVSEQIAELSYADLNRRANQLAHHLLALGVRPDMPVGISVERSLNMVVGLLGIMKAGAAYMPIDPTYPAERIRYMIEDSGVSVLLTDRRSEISGQQSDDVRRLTFDDPAIAARPTANPDVPVSPDHLAYVIYTSGSTGLPKGVMLQHRGLTNLVDAQTHGFAVDEHSRVLQFASFSFDASVSEVFMALYTGATLVLIPPETLQSAETLLAALRQERITTVTTPPSLLSVLEPNDLPALETIISAGEPCTWEIVSRWRLGRRFVNAYGPTEATVGPTYDILDGEQEQTPTVPIGRPTQNVQIHLLSPAMEPTPVGVTGEICIGGVGVGRGYLKRPALTAEKFVPDPFSDQPGARMYRTGDAGRYLADGRIEFLGRIDDQVKVRGYRIELGEIEAVLEQHPHVQSAAVVIPEDGRAKRLVGYIIPAGDQEPQTEELRAFVRTKLPEYMTPTQFEVIEAFPLTPNGKVDRKALAAKELGRAEQMQAFVAPSTEVERLLAQVWQAVLRIDQVGIHDNFFQLGGDSILSIQVISQALALGLRLEPRHIFQHPTIAELAEVAQSSRIHAEQGLVVGDAPLTPWQQRFFELYGAEPHIRSQALLLELPQAPQAEMLEAAAHQVVRHHDALRLRFEQREAGWVQYNAGDEATAVFSIVDLSSLPQAEQADAVIAHATDLRAGMDLTAGPLFRVAYFDLGPERSARLLFLIHDLIIDSLSWPILLQDFLATVGMLERSASVQLPPKTTSFRHWAQRLQEYAQTEAVRSDLDYWLDALNSPAAIPPPDFAEAATVDQADASIVRVLTVDETAALLGDASQAYHTEPLDLLLTALCQVFIHRSDAATLLVDIEDDQRQEAIAEDVDISRTAGRFTATYPVALSPADDDHPGEFIKHIKEQLRSIPHAGLSYGLLRYLHEDAEVRRQLQSRPSAPVAFRFVQSPADAIAELPAIRIAPESPGSVRGQMGEQPYALAVEAVVQDGRMQFEWHYDHQHYRPATIAALADEYALALRALIEHCLSPEAGGFTQSDVVDFGWDETDLQDFEDALSQLGDF